MFAVSLRVQIISYYTGSRKSIHEESLRRQVFRRKYVVALSEGDALAAFQAPEESDREDP